MAPDDTNFADDLSIGNARVDSAATIAARQGAAGITPIFDQLSERDQETILRNLEDGGSKRLQTILRTHARKLTRVELDAIGIE